MAWTSSVLHPPPTFVDPSMGLFKVSDSIVDVLAANDVPRPLQRYRALSGTVLFA